MATAARHEKSKLPPVVPLLALGTFLMCTTEFMIAGLLAQMADDFGVRQAAGLVLVMLIPLSAEPVSAVIVITLLGVVTMAIPRSRLGCRSGSPARLRRSQRRSPCRLSTGASLPARWLGDRPWTPRSVRPGPPPSASSWSPSVSFR
jgi:hypothetical protein